VRSNRALFAIACLALTGACATADGTGELPGPTPDSRSPSPGFDIVVTGGGGESLVGVATVDIRDAEGSWRVLPDDPLTHGGDPGDGIAATTRLPAGRYTGLRLRITDLAVVADGVSEQIDLPSGGAILDIDMTLDIQTAVDYTLVLEADVPAMQREGLVPSNPAPVTIVGIDAGKAPDSGVATERDGDSDRDGPLAR